MRNGLSRRLVYLTVGLISGLVIATESLAEGAGSPKPKFPSAAEVLDKVRGDSELDTTIRQIVVLNKLSYFIRSLAKGGEFRPELTPQEAALSKDYLRAQRAAEKRGPELVRKRSPELEGRKAQMEFTELRARTEAAGAQMLEELWPDIVKAHRGMWTAREAQYQRNLAAEKAGQRPATNAQFGGPNISQPHWWLAAAASILLMYLWSSRPRSLKQGTPSEIDHLPAELRRAKVLGLQYDLTVTSGLIYKVELWSEVNVSTTHYSATEHSAASSSTSVSSTLNRRMWILQADGSEKDVHIWGNGFAATEGQVVSMVYADRNGAIAYNHSTKQLLVFEEQLNKHHAIGGLGFWLSMFSSLLGAVLYSVIARPLLGYELLFLVWTPLFWLTWIARGIFATRLKKKRTRAFVRDYKPRLEAHLREQTRPLLNKLLEAQGMNRPGLYPGSTRSAE